MLKFVIFIDLVNKLHDDIVFMNSACINIFDQHDCFENIQNKLKLFSQSYSNQNQLGGLFQKYRNDFAKNKFNDLRLNNIDTKDEELRIIKIFSLFCGNLNSRIDKELNLSQSDKDLLIYHPRLIRENQFEDDHVINLYQDY